MEIKFKEAEQPKVERTYPYFGRSKNNGLIVLFFSEKTGLTCNNIGYAVGFYSTTWYEKDFILIQGQVTFKS